MAERGLFDLGGRKALVTGSSRGLGLTIARGLAAAGAEVILNGRDEVRLQPAVEALRDDGFDVVGRSFDVTDEQEITSALSDVGPIDVLVNNAGITKRGSLETITRTEFEAIYSVHVTGAFLLSQFVFPGMAERGRGKIINICSLTSESGRTGVGAYMSAKGGLRNLTRALAVDWARHNIQVNGIGPGYIQTELTRPLAEDPQFCEWLIRRTPAGRWGEPEDLIGAAVFLASDASAFVNGQILYVDGGVLASL